MIQEAYVSFETAKLLKEKGFDGACTKTYIQGSGAPIILSVDVGTVLCDNEVYAPTQQMAMRWLREVYNIHISVEPEYMIKNFNKDFVVTGYLYNVYHPEDGNWYEDGESYTTYEKAVESAVKYCLENLL